MLLASLKLALSELLNHPTLPVRGGEEIFDPSTVASSKTIFEEIERHIRRMNDWIEVFNTFVTDPRELHEDVG